MNILDDFTRIRNQSVAFCNQLNSEDCAIQIVPFASPAKWHLAHTTWFFEEFILKKFAPRYNVFNHTFSFLFNSYYNTVGDRIERANRGNMSRPTTDEVYQYRKYVDEKMVELLNHQPHQELTDTVVLGLNHEQQHQELLIMDVKYMFGHNPIFPIYHDEYHLVQDENTTSNSVRINEGIYEIGHNGNSFCYDNERDLHKVYVNDFEIDNRLVTNGEYMEFIEDGGYSNFNFWLDEGWSWVQAHQIKAPLYWHKIQDDWQYYTLSGLQKVDEKALVCHLSFYEANAYAEWKGMRLPTEFEWEIASHQLHWGKRWEWTASAYVQYPNFKKAEGAIGEYNGKFMSNQMVLRGASVATSENHSRYTYRNFFHPAERWQFSGLRLVKW